MEIETMGWSTVTPEEHQTFESLGVAIIINEHTSCHALRHRSHQGKCGREPLQGHELDSLVLNCDTAANCSNQRTESIGNLTL